MRSRGTSSDLYDKNVMVVGSATPSGTTSAHPWPVGNQPV
jgi:hypothetical protein